MNAEQDWSRWQAAWQRQAPIDVTRLLRLARRKRRQMMAILACEWVVALIAIAQTVQLITLDRVALRWKVWAVIAMVLVAISAWLAWRLRRGTWGLAASGNVGALLDLSARRARAGIRLAWANIVGVLVLIVISAALALPWLAASGWLSDPDIRRKVALISVVNSPVVIATIVYGAFYIRRQRRRLAWIQRVRSDEQPDP
jgi:hypothetical protein